MTHVYVIAEIGINHNGELADAVIVRFGKLVPTNDFNNVVRPVPVQDAALQIPAVSGLLYTPIFVNPTILGFIPGYYNSAYGATMTLAPSQRRLTWWRPRAASGSGNRGSASTMERVDRLGRS